MSVAELFGKLECGPALRRATIAALAAVPLLSTVGAQAQTDGPVETPALPSDALAVPGDAETQPDIIVMMIDDLAFIGNERVLERQTAINELWLEGGLRFTQMHTETPLCGPSRAAILTGQHALANGVTGNDGDPMDPSATIATALDDAGYHTMLTGKYLNRYEGTRTPPGWDRILMRESVTTPSFFVDGTEQDFDGRHFDDVLRGTAPDWLAEAPKDEPAFMYVTPRAPHRHPQWCTQRRQGYGLHACQYLPMPMARDRNSAECQDIAPWRPHDYETPPITRPVPWSMPDWPAGWPLEEICESLLVVDRTVAELRAAQEERGRDAVWVLLSDNGMAWGRDGAPQKHVPDASRIPFYVAGTGIEPGKTDVLASNIDIGPTLAELGGSSMPEAHGQSIAALFRGEPFEGRDEMLEIMPDDPSGTFEGWAGLRTPKWRYIRWDDGRKELYDLGADPLQKKNVIAKHKRRARRSDDRLDVLLKASREPAARAAEIEAAATSAAGDLG